MGSVADVVATIPGPLWAIVGVAVGGLLANSHARRMAKDKQKHEDRTRFHDKRLELYAEFIKTAYRLRSLVPRILLEADDQTEAVRHRRERKIQARLNDLRDSVFLLGSPEVNECADDVIAAYWKYWLAHERKDSDTKAWYEALEVKLKDLRSQMRKELEPAD